MQTADVQSAANEIIARVRSQASRLDAMLTHVLDTLERAGNFMADAVNKPMRQLSAISGFGEGGHRIAAQRRARACVRSPIRRTAITNVCLGLARASQAAQAAAERIDMG